jgi:prepilin-type N-terminal cleavage/methylation domain-containing protein
MLKNQKGTSLIEILIALMIFGIGITFAMRMLPESNTATTRGRNLTKATNLAQEKIEELMGVHYNTADLNNGNHTDANNPLADHFTRTWTVAVDSPAPGLKQVVVTVSFPSDNSDNSATLTSIISSSRR